MLINTTSIQWVHVHHLHVDGPIIQSVKSVNCVGLNIQSKEVCTVYGLNIPNKNYLNYVWYHNLKLHRHKINAKEMCTTR